MKFTRAGYSAEIDAEVISRDGDKIRVRVGRREISAQLATSTDGSAVLTIDGRR